MNPVPAPTASFTDTFPSRAPLRLLVFADGYGASQAIAFVDGLRRSRREGRAAVSIVEEAAFGHDGPRFDAEHARSLIAASFAVVRPTVVVLSRFGHAGALAEILEAVAMSAAPLVAHVDDDLFDLPPCLGVERYRAARHPRRIHALRNGVTAADMVLTATAELAHRLARMADPGRVVAMEIGSAGEPRERRTIKSDQEPLIIGYMGSASHDHDLAMIAPALNAVQGRFDHVSIELFGSIADQPAADLLRGRVRRRKAVGGDYRAFKEVLAGLSWDIGLAPLRNIPYNLCKTPTKWVEYAEAGAACIVSRSPVYATVIEGGAALAAGPQDWEGAIAGLIDRPALRRELVEAADGLLTQRYGWPRLEASLLAALSRLASPRLAA